MSVFAFREFVKTQTRDLAIFAPDWAFDILSPIFWYFRYVVCPKIPSLVALFLFDCYFYENCVFKRCALMRLWFLVGGRFYFCPWSIRVCSRKIVCLRLLQRNLCVPSSLLSVKWTPICKIHFAAHSVRRRVKNVVFKWNPCSLVMYNDYNFNFANNGYLNGRFISSPLFYTLLTVEILRFQCLNFHEKILLKAKYSLFGAKSWRNRNQIEAGQICI